MLRFLFYLTISLVLVVSLWGMGRDFLPESFRRGIISHSMDYITRKLTIYALNFANELPANRFDSRIVEVTGDEAKMLIRNGYNTGKPLLLYIYPLDCLLCRMNVEPVSNIAKRFEDEVLTVAIAAHTDPKTFSDFLAQTQMQVHFTPLVFDKDGMASMEIHIGRMPGHRAGTKLHDLPYLAIFEVDKDVKTFTVGLGTENNLYEYLVERLEQDGDAETP